MSILFLLGQINRVKHFFDKNALIIIINVLVFSKLFCCSSVWSNTNQFNLNKLKAVKNFACRIVSGAGKFDHITPLLKGLRWFPVKQQLYFRLQRVCSSVLKFVKRSAVRQGQPGTRKCWEYHSSALPSASERTIQLSHLSTRWECETSNYTPLKYFASRESSTPQSQNHSLNNLTTSSLLVSSTPARKVTRER